MRMDLRSRTVLNDPSQDREPVDLWQPHVAHHELEGPRVEPRHRLGAVGRCLQAVALRAQHRRQRLANRGLIVHQ